MIFSPAKSWFGACLQAGKPAIVRSTRSLTGRISHAAVAAPAAATNKNLAPAAGCIGIHESLTLWLDTPFSSRNKAASVLPAMLDVQLPFQLNDCCYCFTRFRKNESGNLSALAVAARRAIVEQKIQAYQACGLDPVIIDHEGLALWDASLREKPPLPGAVRAVVCLEPDHAAFVTGTGREYRNSHSLRLPATPGADASPDDIFRRIHRNLRAELQSAARVEWLFCGSLARQPAFIGNLHRLLSAEWPGPFAAHKFPDVFLPRALAARALAGGAERCNLRQGDLTHPGLRRAQKRKATASTALFLAAGIVLCAFNLAWQAAGAAFDRAARNEITRLAAEIAPGAVIPYGREAEEAAKIVRKKSSDNAPALDYFARPLPVRLADIISAGKECRVAFMRLELSREKTAVSGTSEDWNYCERLEKQLRHFGYQTEMERKEAQDDNLVHFNLRGTAKP